MALVRPDRNRQQTYSFAAFANDDNTVAELKRTLKSDSLTNNYIVKGGISTAIDWLRKQENSPQRLLVDISDLPRPLDALDRLADACSPSVEVFVLGERNDVGLFRNLLARGVTDYLVKPITTDLLRKSFSNSEIRSTRHGKCVLVAGTRGGVGVSSIATHLAAALVKGGVRRRVVYLDLNIYDGSGASLMGVPGGTSLTELLANTDQLDQQYLERALSDLGDGLFVLNAELDYSDSFELVPSNISKLLHALVSYFHYVVIDSNIRSGVVFNQILKESSIICTVADPSVHSARVLTRLNRYIENVVEMPTILSILNHVRPANNAQIKDSDFEEAVGSQLRLHIHYDPKATQLTENLGEGLSLNDEFTKDVNKLAKFVTGEAIEYEQTSWLQKLFRR